MSFWFGQVDSSELSPRAPTASGPVEPKGTTSQRRKRERAAFPRQTAQSFTKPPSVSRMYRQLEERSHRMGRRE
ncbi:MAG: hypothetical protein Q8P67_05735 [archaeon]|nr:hypothetical protein [archaeon]